MILSKWKPGCESLFHADAQLVANEILEIGDDVTPEQIVERATDKNSELHKCFTWDDTEAGKKWRKHEARQVLCCLVIKRPPEEKKKPEVRVFHKTKGDEGYKPVTLIVRKEDEYTSLLQRALGELRAFQMKYSVLSDNEELRNLIEQIEEMIQVA